MGHPITTSAARQYGASALELISTLSVSLILLSMGIPAVQSLTTSSNMTTAINGISGHLQLARSKAITHYERVVVCPSSDGQWCLDDFTWHQGYILFFDTNDNKEREADETLVGSYRAGAGPVEIYTTTGRRYIQFMPDGTLNGFSNTTFTFCDPSGRQEPRKITIDRAARIKLWEESGESDRCL